MRKLLTLLMVIALVAVAPFVAYADSGQGADWMPVLNAIIPVAVGAIGVFGSWALRRLAQQLKVKLNQAQLAAFDDALAKAIHYGAGRATAVIQAQGWDHVDTKNAILTNALNYIVPKFPDALKGVGIDPTDPQFAVKINDALNRAFPTAMAAVAASPVTPAVPVAPVPAAA